MRRFFVVFTLGAACTAAPQEAAPEVKQDVAPATPVPPARPVETLPPVAVPEVPPAPNPTTMPALQLGPDRWQFPAELRCDDQEPGPFCGVHILDVATRQTTTLVSRDVGKTWVVRDGKKETPTAAEFIEMPRAADLLQRVEPTFGLGPGAFISVRPPHPALPEPFTLPQLRSLVGDFVLLGDKLYVEGIGAESGLFEVDPKTKTAQLLEFGGKDVVAALPGGPNLAVYLEGKRRRSVGLYDPATQALTVELEIPRPLEPECRRTHHFYGEDEVAFVPASSRFYVGFSCIPDA